MTDKERLAALCAAGMEARGLVGIQTAETRLKDELREIDAQNEFQYFLEMYDAKTKYPKNQNNLLVPYLLGIVNEYEGEKPPEYKYGEFPDIDIDYLPMVRDYLKNTWAPKEFGQDRVCNIGSYTSFGIKSTLIDMAKVHDKSREEIMALTKQIGLKDEDGKTLTFDKALEMYPDLKTYCEVNPDVADATRRLLHRNRGMGMHAGGLIISSVPIADLVPLVRGKDNTQVSAWVEGLHGQDLGPMGLVKFDLLVITNILQIAKACKLIWGRYGVPVMAKDGLPNWSDTAYLNDPKALKLANEGDLKCIFQFDSEGIRKLAKDGGVTNFEDLVAYTALYRPGPLGMKMQERYVERKRGREEYKLHPLLQPVLSKTYGVLCYQEQVMQVLHVVGDIPLKDCEAIRKAISKKEEKKFLPYMAMFLENGKKNLGVSDEEIKYLWDQIAAFAEYGFNRSHAVAYTFISSRLLYLKAHYPLEFYTAVLSCESQADKIKEYKLEAHKHDIEVSPLDINKSNVRFDIVDEKIYFGISSVKGIGDEVAAEIVKIRDEKPFTDFQDFLVRYGTDANTVKPLLALGAFEGDPIRMWKYYEYYKKAVKSTEEKKKRFQTTMKKYDEELKEILGDQYPVYGHFNEDMMKTWTQLDQSKVLDKLWKKYKRSVDTFQRKEEDVENKIKDMKDWVPEDWKVEKEWESVLLDPFKAQKEYLGFLWTHPIESSPDYAGGRTFDAFRAEIEARDLAYSIVEVMVKSVQQKTSKNGNVYYTMITEDANSEEGMVIVWQDDFERFQQEFKADTFLRMTVAAPDAGFKSYKFYAPPRHLRHRLPPKRDDLRVYVMQPGTVMKPTQKPREDSLDDGFDMTDINAALEY